MAIESTLNQQQKYLRCHMKPASFFLHVFLERRQLLKLPHLRKLNILYSFEETFIFFI